MDPDDEFLARVHGPLTKRPYNIDGMIAAVEQLVSEFEHDGTITANIAHWFPRLLFILRHEGGECQSSCRFLLMPYEVARESAPSMVS
jgi:hypothetical protein